ncbi:MAG: 2-oxo-hepta-3-ene-1,7-dioic acid hydratase [Acidimicrobiales bacterium]|jgi:2-oxo-hept-3-ene-1,7-dioate hydratase|nr:2-oxo-hepta-3-ene-1,7-dioic acid hydratase [Acidimicrobiales bacterium]MDP6902240.1 2-oxo-hepta-3-ene-1,7-dioic acid hydratase [Acidimicrobiales bacterium]
MDDSDIGHQAHLHDEARRTANQIDPVTVEHPQMTIDDAYAIQNRWLQIELERGRQLVGHKIGLTSRAMQLAMNIDEPDSGYLLDDMVFENGCRLEVANFCDPKIEVELAFIIGSRIEGPDVTVDEVLGSTEAVVPAIELIDARSYRKHPRTGVTRSVTDTISDNAADAGIILGDCREDPKNVDLPWVAAVCRRNGDIEESGVASAVLGHPALGVAWLAKRYSDRGVALEPGQIVLSGSFTRPVDCRVGDDFEVDYRDLGTIEFSFG